MSTRLERLIYIAARIGEGDYPSAQSFAERFEVSKRTIQHDIEFLEVRINAPIAYSRAREGYYYTDPHWTLSTLPVTEGQLLAFFLSIELVELYLGTSFENPLRNAIQRITSTLTDEVQLSVSELISHYSVRTGASAKASMDLLLAMQRAIQHRHPVEVVYFTASRGQETRRVLHPYHIFNIHGDWQVIAFDLFRLDVRQFALQRIREWRILEEETFDIDPGFSADQYFERSFEAEHGYEAVDVILRFDAHQAPYIRERTWHPSQIIEAQEDGGIEMRFTTGAIGEIRRWVMRYGRHVRVISPEGLKQSIIDEFRASLAEYEKNQ